MEKNQQLSLHIGIVGSALTTGCPDQIRPIFKITLLLNYKTYRKSEDSFKIVEKRATKNYLA